MARAAAEFAAAEGHLDPIACYPLHTASLPGRHAAPGSETATASTALLAAYTDPILAPVGRLMDVPHEVAARALEFLPADLAGARLNLVQPPMTWLVAQAAERPGGRLTGSLTAGRGLVVFDGIQVDAATPCPETTPTRLRRAAAALTAASRHPRRRQRPRRSPSSGPAGPFAVLRGTVG